MKILVMSDSHSSLRFMRLCIDRLKPQHVVHLGDLYEDAQAISEEDKVKVYTSGTTNMLKYPELGDNGNVSQLLYALEEKNEITELMKKEAGDTNEIQVYIGNETTVESMKDCSVVTATYELTDGVYGKIGIVGPKRMDYEKVVSTLKTIRTQLDEIYKK